MTAHACHLDDLCGVRCLGGCDERMCAEDGPEPAVRCVDHPMCVDCAEPTTCTECLRVMWEQTADLMEVPC